MLFTKSFIYLMDFLLVIFIVLAMHILQSDNMAYNCPNTVYRMQVNL